MHRSAQFLIAPLVLVTGVACAQQPACPNCLNTAPVYWPQRQVSYVLVQSARTSNCGPSDSGWNLANDVYAPQLGPTVRLVSIHDPIENVFILDNVMSKPEIQTFAWIGLRAASGCTGFNWSDGTALDYTSLCGGNACGDTGCSPGTAAYGAIDKGNRCWKFTIPWRQCCSGQPIYGIVRIACPDSITLQPSGQSVAAGGTLTLSVGVSALTPQQTYQRRITYQWRKNGQSLSDGPTGCGSTVFGARCLNTPVTTCQLFIQNACAGDAGEYDVVVTTTCRPEFVSASAVVTIEFCPSDFDRSGTVDGDDVIAFFQSWDANGADADFNADGGVDGDDIIAFFTRWDSGC